MKKRLQRTESVRGATTFFLIPNDLMTNLTIQRKSPKCSYNAGMLRVGAFTLTLQQEPNWI